MTIGKFDVVVSMESISTQIAKKSSQYNPTRTRAFEAGRPSGILHAHRPSR
jgi:hypothetical protein